MWLRIFKVTSFSFFFKIDWLGWNRPKLEKTWNEILFMPVYSDFCIWRKLQYDKFNLGFHCSLVLSVGSKLFPVRCLIWIKMFLGRGPDIDPVFNNCRAVTNMKNLNKWVVKHSNCFPKGHRSSLKASLNLCESYAFAAFMLYCSDSNYKQRVGKTSES